VTISLPNNPSGPQFEDRIGAVLKALGYFVESRLVLKDGDKEILELDHIASAASGPSPDRVLYEVKRNAISFPNLFKLFGQRSWLGINEACLVSVNAPHPAHLPVYIARAKDLGIRVCIHDPANTPPSDLTSQLNQLLPSEIEAITAVGWYQEVAKRLAWAGLNAERKNRPGSIAIENVREYAFSLHAAFFLATPLARAEALYSAYLNTPKMARAALLEVADSGGLEKVLWNKVYDDGEYYWIQSIMRLEWTARLQIVKNALDDYLQRGGAPPPTTTLKVGALVLAVPLNALPQSFHAGLARLASHATPRALPYLFQIFIEVFGGFMFYKDARELELMSRATGIPPDQILPSLMHLDDFFGQNGSLFYTQKDELLYLKMVPAFMKGTGAFLRHALWADGDYTKTYPTSGWLLSRWHNAAYNLLAGELKG
jgi:hypothetical protein